MAEIEITSLIRYPDEVLIELLDTDDYGSPRVISYRYEYADDSMEIVAPKGSIEPNHRAHVESAIEEEGLRLSG